MLSLVRGHSDQMDVGCWDMGQQELFETHSQTLYDLIFQSRAVKVKIRSSEDSRESE